MKTNRNIIWLALAIFALSIFDSRAAVLRSMNRGIARQSRHPQYRVVPVYQAPIQQVQPAQERPPQVQYTFAPSPPQDPAKVEASKKKVTENTIHYLQQRAEDGSASAQFTLGMRYMKGDGVSKDVEKARAYLQKAADGGFASAQRELNNLQTEPAKEAQPSQQTKKAESENSPAEAPPKERKAAE